MNRTTIMCYGDSNTWGYCAATGGRYEDDDRWTMRLQSLLGPEYYVVEEGLCGRTTVFDDPLNPGLNGRKYFPAIAGAHAPLDLLVVMLGTNDCKERFSANPQNIADGLARLVREAKGMDLWRTQPRILLVAPIHIGPEVSNVPRIGLEMGAGCVEKSLALPALVEQVARDLGCWFLDCNPYVTPGPGDWMHFSQESNAPFAAAMEEKVRAILEQGEPHN